MPKVFTKILFAGALLSHLSAIALYNGNPMEPKLIEKGLFIPCNKIGFKLGYEGDFLYDRELKVTGKPKSSIDRFKYLIYQGVVSLNIKKRAEVYGSVGGMKAHFHQHCFLDHLRREYHTETDLTWGVGARGIVFRKRSTRIGIDLVYQSADLSMTFSNKASLKYRDWQAGLGISQQIDLMAPYLAFTCAGAFAKLPSSMHLGTTQFRLRNRHTVGIALGCSFSTGQFVDLNVEARVLDQQAFTLAGNIKF